MELTPFPCDMAGFPQCSGHDRQWELNRRNFEGRWCGTSSWFLRDERGRLDLHTPSRVIDNTCYAIGFSDADTGVWDGSGLLFAPGGQRCLPLSREGYNSGGQCWQFAGAGGQSSLVVDPTQSRFGHEVNLFHEGSAFRSRSMLVLLWGRRDSGADPGSDAGPDAGPDAGSGPDATAACVGSPVWQLHAVGAVPSAAALLP